MPSGQSHDRWRSWTSVSDCCQPGTLWLSRSVIFIFACAMFVATWASWPDLIVDCGRELYVPWALLQGKRLYRDVWYPYGPLAPDVIALLLRIFGANLNTFYGTGLAMFTASALVLHSIALRFVPPIVALLCALVFLAQGFQPILFNYIVPYSYAATFMCFLCLLTLLFLLRYVEHKGLVNLCAAGLCAGLASISKIEAVLPCAAGMGGALILCAWRSANPVRTLRLAVVALLPGFLVSATVFLWLIVQIKIDFLVHGNWASVPGSYFMQRYGSFWIRKWGLRVVPSEMGDLALHTLGAALFWSAIAWLSWKRRWLVVAALVLLAAFFTHLFHGLSPSAQLLVSAADSRLIFDLSFPRGMFLIAVALLAVVCVQAIRLRQSPPIALFITVIFALMLGFRVMAEIYPSGYAIFSSPLLLLVFFAALWNTFLFVRPMVSFTSNAIPVFTCFAAYAFLFARMISWSYSGITLPTEAQTPDTGAMARFGTPLIRAPLGYLRRTRQNEILMNQFLPVIEDAKQKGQKVLLLPELTGLYFVAGILAPSRYELLLPGVLEPGKYTDGLLHELEINRPDLIIVSNRRTSEYGVNYFGLDYDQDVLRWIEEHYRNVGEIGHFERSPQAPLSALMFRPK